METIEATSQITINDISVSLQGIDDMQRCGSNLRGLKPRIFIKCEKPTTAIARILLFWKSPDGLIVVFPPKILRIGSVPSVCIPINTEVSLARVKFPTNFGEVKKVLEDELKIKIKDSKLEDNQYKRNYGLRIEVQDAAINWEGLFCLSHSKEMSRNNRKQRVAKMESDIETQ